MVNFWSADGREIDLITIDELWWRMLLLIELELRKNLKH